MRRTSLAVAVVAVMGLGRTPDATADSKNAQDWCSDGSNWGRGARFCEVREFTLAAGPRLEVDGTPNGGVKVNGEARGDVRVLAKVETQAASDDEARALAAEIKVATSGTVQATGPEHQRGRSWSVSFRVSAPEATDLTLRAQNGGLHVERISGEVDARTTNGGVHLNDVGGKVVARSVNGGLHVELSDGWQGQGVEAETTNGGVHVELPDQLDAHLEASTVNGGIHSDLPGVGRQEGRRRSNGGRISVDLGRGGPVLRLSTTNGGVHISH